MKFVLGIALALGLAAVVYGAAAALTVNGGAAQSGAADVSCDDDGVAVSYTIVGGEVTTITVSDIDSTPDNGEADPDTCNGATLTVTTDSSVGGEDDTETLVIDDDTETVDPTDVAIADLDGVTVSITN